MPLTRIFVYRWECKNGFRAPRVPHPIKFCPGAGKGVEAPRPLNVWVSRTTSAVR
jgi:hypothetical protein